MIRLESFEKEQFQMDLKMANKSFTLKRYLLDRVPETDKIKQDSNESSTSTCSNTEAVDTDCNCEPNFIVPVGIRGEILKLIIAWGRLEMEKASSNPISDDEKCGRRKFVDDIEPHLLIELSLSATFLGLPVLCHAISERIADIYQDHKPEEIRLKFHSAFN